MKPGDRIEVVTMLSDANYGEDLFPTGSTQVAKKAEMNGFRVRDGLDWWYVMPRDIKPIGCLIIKTVK